MYLGNLRSIVPKLEDGEVIRSFAFDVEVVVVAASYSSSSETIPRLYKISFIALQSIC